MPALTRSRHLGLTLALLGLGAACGPPPLPRPPHRFSPPGARFEVWTYSGRGAMEGGTTERAFGNGKQWRMFGDDDQMVYHVAEYRAPHAPASVAELERRATQWASARGQLVERAPVDQDGRPGLRFGIRYETGSTTFARVYLDGTDYYVLEVWTGTFEPTPTERQHAESFLSSFRFLEPST